MTGYKSYARTNIQTSDPRAVVVLLYEGAIGFLNQAADAARRDARMDMSTFLLKTLKIVQFLDAALDFDQGGEVAENLNRLYAYMRDSLSEANLTCQPEKIEEVVDLLKTLLGGWREVASCPEAATALSARGAAVAGASPGGAASVDLTDSESATEDMPSSAPPPQSAFSPPLAEERPSPRMAPATSFPPNAFPATVQAGRSAYGIR
ncbi:MAG TPA: flagellar export chaperone FliS [Sumerlaeia bacterium]|nr:flagellar export chaperone FliS [Sumerlaeia bacterium]